MNIDLFQEDKPAVPPRTECFGCHQEIKDPESPDVLAIIDPANHYYRFYQACGYRPIRTPSGQLSCIHFQCISKYELHLEPDLRTRWMEWRIRELEDGRKSMGELIENISQAIARLDDDTYSTYIKEPNLNRDLNQQTDTTLNRNAPEQTPPWGTPGCPILAQPILLKLAETKTPEEIQAVLNDLNRKGGNTRMRIQVRDLLAPGKFRKGWCVVPAGIPREWVERLPASARTRNSIQRHFRSFYGLAASPWPAEGLTVEQFTGLRNIGIVSANELACLIESTEKAVH